jgi:hypothetical protein
MPVIKVKTGAGTPSGGTMQQGELAYDTSNNYLHVGNASGNPVKIVGSLASQNSNSVAITGGSVSGTVSATSANLTSLNLAQGEPIAVQQ